jgi:pyrimidine-specific ribonucleoside hydrolase
MTLRRVWIDTDPAITAGNGEVDDAFALVQALRSPELEIAGVSAVFGNTDIDHTFVMAREIVARANRADIPVYRGSGCRGDRFANEATSALTQALSEGPLTILALGPLTTIAATLGLRDAPTESVEEIVFVGGRREGLEFLATPTQKKPFGDMNFECDPAAASELLALGVPMTLAGWEVSSKTWLAPHDLDRLRDEGGECARWLAASARAWQSDWQRNFAARGFTPFDTLAVGWLLLPDAFARHRWPTRISHDGQRPLFVADPSFDGPIVTYLLEVDNDRFHADLMRRLQSG